MEARNDHHHTEPHPGAPPFDGYPTGHGQEIKEAFQGRKLVNGIGSDRKILVNGMGCAAALLIAKLKADGEAGNVYVYPANASDCGEEYTYVLSNKDYKLYLAVFIGTAKAREKLAKAVWHGTLESFNGESVEQAA